MDVTASAPAFVLHDGERQVGHGPTREVLKVVWAFACLSHQVPLHVAPKLVEDHLRSCWAIVLGRLAACTRAAKQKLDLDISDEFIQCVIEAGDPAPLGIRVYDGGHHSTRCGMRGATLAADPAQRSARQRAHIHRRV